MAFFLVCRDASLPNTANDNAQVPMPCWACGVLYIMYASAYLFI